MLEKSYSTRFQASRVVAALMVREMITRYGRSWGGYFWAIAEPVGMIAILSLAFSQFLRSPPIGQSFVLFYATGFIPFHFYAILSSQVSNSISFNRSLLSFPMVTALDAVLARSILAFLTMIVVTAIVFAGIAIIVAESFAVSLENLFLACLASSVLGAGLGTLNTVIFAYLPFWQNVWAILNRPMFIISGIFFTYESMPTAIQDILWWNPLIHVVGEARVAFYPIYDGDYIFLAYPFAVGIFCFLLGGVLLLRNRSYIVENS